MEINRLKELITEIIRNKTELGETIANAVEDYPDDVVTDFYQLTNEILDTISENSGIFTTYEAFDYIKENDPTMSLAMDEADEMGYRCSELNPSLIASLLNVRLMKNAFSNIEKDIRELIDEYDMELYGLDNEELAAFRMAN